jgi:hypothetical protein
MELELSSLIIGAIIIVLLVLLVTSIKKAETFNSNGRSVMPTNRYNKVPLRPVSNLKTVPASVPVPTSQPSSLFEAPTVENPTNNTMTNLTITGQLKVGNIIINSDDTISIPTPNVTWALRPEGDALVIRDLSSSTDSRYAFYPNENKDL